MSNKFIVNETEKGIRLDVYLHEKLDKTRSHVQLLCEKGLVLLNGETFDRVGYKVKVNDEIVVNEETVEKLDLTPQDVEFEIVYEDNDLAVINKPQGLVVHPCETTKSGTLVNGLLLKLDNLSGINGVERPGIVHRLDKNTSGLLVVAKNDFAHVELQKQIASKECRRTYRAIVDGNIKEDSGTVNMPIGRSKKNRKIMAIDLNGRSAITEYTVLERFGKYTYVEYNLLTGRTHQIRVHTKYLHHPVIGDKEYGGSNEFNLKGQLLHAYKLAFTHPRTNTRVEFTAPLPDYFEAILSKLRNNLKKD